MSYVSSVSGIIHSSVQLDALKEADDGDELGQHSTIIEKCNEGRTTSRNSAALMCMYA